MPELPEVETTRRGLVPVLEGQKIGKVIKRRDKIRIPIPEDFVKRIEGQYVRHIKRRAKYLQIFLQSDDVIICHLGMSGKFIIKHKDNEPFGKHDHVIFETTKGDLAIYNDPRRFGVMTICHEDELDNHKLFNKMAVEPLGNEFNGQYLFDKINKKKSAIKGALLDQSVVVGLGNIYVCEALNEARISPLTKGCDVTIDQAEMLVPIIRNILNRAIEAGGSSLKDFAKVDGDLGYFQHQFTTYGRENEPCKNKDCSGVIERIAQGGRSTFYCPNCQN
ncbi:MAG: bifunctional DNA-formamidopyrimidine glycosylase/DNA-(apurinic or apyrimidinic site) lyase [Kordiimonadaceae bacterium]|jgi:formamidopyrimidine-DNA glycosylase|nr:bifunctional DNA-formamidopyrimidine glycosylase/DNA-(apurinic or apyrimidinic site) lyase [Kordiimonadaceae bacterium]MBT6033090.1 bifunctional DNA-formamidopyrimidine glycosylase/DNA-(apurinic or apyrimidinic site) lyase [Kordiimonadaceae bacterium]